MENMHTDFLRECEAEIAALKERIALLEERLAAFAAQPAPQAEEEVDFTGVDISTVDLEPAATAGVESSTGAVDREGSQSDVVVEASSGAVSSAGTFARTGSRSDVEVEDSAPEEAPMIPRETYPWQLAAPGATVKNIRSGISLLDRALFIGTLFKEDYALYDATIAALNGMGSLQEAEDYILAHFPEWNLKSDAVFNFMMAVRKKLG